ncbi:HTH-type transcriptional regulator ImmR [compost metagenome]
MFSHRLRKLRTEAKLTQIEVSERLGIARTTYASYEQGNREPDLETLDKIASLFDVDIDYLLGRVDIPKSSDSEQQKSNSNYHKLQRFAKRHSEQDLERAVKILDAAFEDAFSEDEDEEDGDY